ncbi:hypothetical protein PS833_00780 [Pseudomonas fluorescens]|uniref:Uncharacterized protein n=1 Tax=Pseudomonas fluorescens TaxID=294 RepID=A0A5E7AET9_PSEFL|nr:hypothetical protein PS833_00780 [Pseudomonas fluorescens]
MPNPCYVRIATVSALGDQNYNTTRKQVEGMKTIITFSVILLLAATPGLSLLHSCLLRGKAGNST